KSKLVLGIDFGGIIEVVTSSNITAITADTNNQNLVIVNDTSIQFPLADDKIQSVINPPNSSSKPMPTTSSTSQSSPSNVGAIV
ncbi:15813_t:CDS:2, partial [Racocetra fulgida]